MGLHFAAKRNSLEGAGCSPRCRAQAQLGRAVAPCGLPCEGLVAGLARAVPGCTARALFPGEGALEMTPLAPPGGKRARSGGDAPSSGGEDTGATAGSGGAGPRLPAASMAAGEGYAVTDAAAVSEDMMQSPDQLVAEAEANSLDLGG